MRRLALSLLALAACAHAPAGRGHATARLLNLEVQPSPRGELRFVARYQLDGLPLAPWRGTAAQLSLSLDDIPFGALVAEPKLLPGDALELPLAVAFSRAPREVTEQWASGAPVRVRLRGQLRLEAGEERERIYTDTERAVVLPATALPPPRG